MDGWTEFSRKENATAQEIKRNENDGNINPYLNTSDPCPIDILKLLPFCCSEKAVAHQCLDLLIYHKIKNELGGSLSYFISTFEDQSNSNEQRIFSLILLKIMINKTSFDEELDIPPNFISLLFLYFPHSLAISVCSDLIKRDVIYYQQFLQDILSLNENSTKDSLSNFFINLMQQNLLDALILLQSFLQYKENLIYLDLIFEEILMIITSCEVNEKTECFNVLTNFFNCDDLYYSKLVSEQSPLDSLFSDLEENESLIKSALQFANEVTRSNYKKTLNFIKLSRLDQMLVNILPSFYSNEILLFTCKISERIIQAKGIKGIDFLLDKNIISVLDSIKSKISYTSFQHCMHMLSRCVLKGSISQITAILQITPLIDFAQYASRIDKVEATPFLNKLSTIILNDYETSANELMIDEDTYNELINLADQENDEDQITEFLNSISHLFEN